MIYFIISLDKHCVENRLESVKTKLIGLPDGNSDALLANTFPRQRTGNSCDGTFGRQLYTAVGAVHARIPDFRWLTPNSLLHTTTSSP